LRIADRYAVGRPAGEGGARGLVTAREAIVTDTSESNGRGLHYYLLPKDEDPVAALKLPLTSCM
jgi:hypothetical protein